MQREKHSDAEIFHILNPLLADWFRQSFGSFTEPQKYAIMNIHSRENTLVSAETGTGKTLAAFTAILNELITLSEHGQLENRVYCIYISPLRALNNDIEKNLLKPLNEIKEAAEKNGKKIEVRIAVRTGDTPASERAKMLRNAPHILISTPETTAIILNAPKFREHLAGVQWCVVDEIHALADNKRGVHLSLSMERLQRLSPKMTRIGLSATIAPLDKIAEFLAGMKNNKEARDCKVVDVSFLKKMDLAVISPLPDLINTAPEQIHGALYNSLDKMIQGHRTTLIFTNTRSATERVVHNLKEDFPKNYWKANIETHHSSISREHRLNVENRLKEGMLKAVVSSTSLELGIDIGYIDLVVLISSPKSIARAVQRIGRSGHRLHDSVKGRLLVVDRDDLIECAVLVKNALAKRLDRIDIPENCLDVLAQQIYGTAIAEKIHIDELYKLVKGSYCYRSLSRLDFNEVISYLAGEYSSLETRHVYAKIWLDPETGMMGRRGKMARIIYMTNVGTIPDEAKITVKVGEHKVGTIDEGFLERLNRGDVFVLGGESYLFKYARGMTVQVVPAFKRPPTVPSWFSEMLPLSFDLAVEIGNFRRLMEEKFRVGKKEDEITHFIMDYLGLRGNAAKAVYSYFREQHLYTEIPHTEKLVIEFYREGGMRHIIFHSLFGRRVNDALSRAYAFAISRLMHKDVEIGMNDNGFMISCNAKMPLEAALKAVKSEELEKLLGLAIDRSEVLNRRFRHCAARALMILRSYKGREKSAGRQQMSSRLLINAVRRISNDFPVLKEARREVLHDLMDVGNAKKVVKAIEDGRMKVRRIDVELPSPFAFNIYAQGYLDVMKMEDRLVFLRRMHEKIGKKIKEKNLCYIKGHK